MREETARFGRTPNDRPGFVAQARNVTSPRGAERGCVADVGIEPCSKDCFWMLEPACPDCARYFIQEPVHHVHDVRTGSEMFWSL